MNKMLSDMARVLYGVIAVSGCVALSEAAEPQGRRATLSDLGVRVGLSSSAISPDGKHVVVVTSRANYADNSFTHSLVLVDSGTGAQRVIATAGSGVSSPHWSPSGDQLAWLESEDGKPPQLYVMPMSEPGGRAVRITSAIKGVSTNVIGFQPYAWSPDGKAIAFVTAEPKEEAQGEERHNKSFEVGENDYLATEAPLSFHVWLVSSAGGEAKRLNSGVESTAGIGWLRGSQSLAFVGQPRPHNSELDFAEFMDASSQDAALKSIDIASGSQDVIVPRACMLSAPNASPNGDLIAYRRSRGPEPWARPNDVVVISPSGGEPRVLTAALDRDISDYAWLPDSKAVVLTGPNGTRMALWVQPVDGPTRRLDLGPVIELSGLTVSKTGVLAFVGTESRHPPELYIMKSLDATPQRLTTFNEQLAALDIGPSETIQWKSDGFEQSGVLIFPPGFKPGNRYPLVLNIHGGPEGTSTEAFDLLGQILASQGWLVFKPNYRGSNSQGDAYQSAVINDLGDGPGRDVMAGIAAVKARGFVDEERVAVSGWSYGGYMTAWLIGHYQGWRAAVVGAPLTNMLDWYDLSCCSVWAKSVLSGSPWVNGSYKDYWRQSPVAYADKVKTPTLLLHHKGDPEAPFTQSFNFYHALRDNGVEVSFVLYPINGHSYAVDPIHERDTFRRWINWIDEHFRAPSSSP